MNGYVHRACSLEADHTYIGDTEGQFDFHTILIPTSHEL